MIFSELRRTTIAFIFADAAVAKLLAFYKSCKTFTAYRANDHGRKQERGSLERNGFAIRNFTDFFVLFRSYVSFAVIIYVIFPAGINVVGQDPVDLVRSRSLVAISGNNIGHRAAFGKGCKVVLKDVFDDVAGIRILYQAFFRICDITISGFSVYMLPETLLIFENIANSFAGSITLIFIHGKHDVNCEATVRCGRIVFFENGFPVAVMCFQNSLCIMVIFDIPEPPVKLRNENQINLISFHIVQQPDQITPVLHFLSGSNSFISIVTNNFIVVGQGIIGEGFLLSIQGQAFPDLYFGTYTIINRTSDFRHVNLLYINMKKRV